MRPLRLFGHPIHPATVHLPIGLLVGAALLDAIGLVASGSRWVDAAEVLRWGGLLAVVPAGLTGFLEYAAIPLDHPAGPTATVHLSSVSAAVMAFGVAALLAPGGWPGLAAEGIGVVAIGVAGFTGGDLVYRYRLPRDPD